MHAITSLLYMFQCSMNANREYIYISEKAPIYMLPRMQQSTKMQQTFGYRHTRKTSGLSL